MRKAALACLLIVGVFLTACGDDADKPYLEFTGGGFIFNYRIAEAYYGFVAKPTGAIPEGTVIVAKFEDPAGGPPITVKQSVKPSKRQYIFRTPVVKGIVKGRPYAVIVKLIQPTSDRPLAVYSREYESSIDQADLSSIALTIGLGYQPNPELLEANNQSFVRPGDWKE